MIHHTDRTPRVARPVHAAVSKGRTKAQGDLRKPRGSIHPGKRAGTPSQDVGYYGGENNDAGVPHKGLRAGLRQGRRKNLLGVYERCPRGVSE
jgi:hypothetical protein